MSLIVCGFGFAALADAGKPKTAKPTIGAYYYPWFTKSKSKSRC